MDSLKQIDREALELLKIQHRVNDARTEAANRKRAQERVRIQPNRTTPVAPKPHFILRAILGKFSGQIWWAVIASPDQLKSATRHPNSGTAIRGASRLELYKLTQRRCVVPPNDRWIKHEMPGIERPTDAELATMPSPIAAPHSPNCPCGACSGKAYRNSTM